MCICVTVEPAGHPTQCDNKRELRAALGIEPIPYGYANLTEWTDESCLCPCDIEATAAAAGFSASIDDTGAYTLRPIGE